MSLTVLTTPKKTIGSYVSTCISVTQVTYTLQREDYQVESLLASADKIILPASEGDKSADFSPGDKVYYNDDTTYDNVFTVASVIYDSGPGKTVIDIVEDVVATGGAGYLNIVSNAYLCYIRLSEFDLDLYYVPNGKGLIRAEIGQALERVIADEGSTTQPYYSEIINGSQGSETQFTDELFITLAKRQLLAEHGANLYKFIAKNPDPAIFLTTTSKTWLLWRNVVSFINMDYNGVLIDVVKDHLDINKNVISANPTTQLVLGPSISKYQIIDPPESNVYFIGIQFKDGANAITEYKYLEIKEECKNPVMVEWLNRNGAYDQYLFNLEQTVQNTAEEGLKYQTPITEDIETVTRTKQRYTEKDVQLMTLKADNLSQTDIQALHDIKASNDVRVWLAKDASSYVGVTVPSGYSTDFTTGKKGYEFFLNIEFPDNFDFFKAKQY